MENLYFLLQMVQQNYQVETTNSKNPLTLRREPTVRRERTSAENLKATWRDSTWRNKRWRGKTSGLLRRFHFIVVILNHEFNFSCHSQFHWRKLISSGHLKPIWTLQQTKRMDDCWKEDGNRNLLDSWTGFTRFASLNEFLPRGQMWSGGRLTKIQTTSRPDHMWPVAWIRIGKPLKTERNKNGQSRNQNWNILIQLIKSTNKAKVRGTKGSCDAMQKSVLPS